MLKVIEIKIKEIDTKLKMLAEEIEKQPKKPRPDS